MRVKDKIEKYLDRLMKTYSGECIESEYSRYYSFNGRVIRVSDHVGRNSSGNMSIIISTTKNVTAYILHTHEGGNIRVINYEDLKKFCQSFAMMSSFVNSVLNDGFKFEIDKRDALEYNAVVADLTAKNTDLRRKLTYYAQKARGTEENLVCGVSMDLFSKGQKTLINTTVESIKKKYKLID